MKHHGQTTSETTSIRRGCWPDMSVLLLLGGGGEPRRPAIRRQPPGSPITRIIRLSRLSPVLRVASVTLAVIGCCGSSALRMWLRSVPASRRTTTWAWLQVGLRQRHHDGAVVVAGGEIDVADQPRQQPGAVEAGALLVGALEGKARQRQRQAAVGRLRHGGVEIAPEGVVGQKAGLRIDGAAGVERGQHALEPRLDGVQAHGRDQPRHQRRRIATDAIEIDQDVVEVGRRVTDQRHRQIAIARFFGEQREKALDLARRQAVADHHAVDIAHVEMGGGGLRAERAHDVDALGGGDAERGIKRRRGRRSAGWRRRGHRGSAVRRTVPPCGGRGSRCGAGPSHAARARAAPRSAARPGARPAAWRRTAARTAWRRPGSPGDARHRRHDRRRWRWRSAGRACGRTLRVRGAPGSAMTTAAGLTAMKAVGASAHLASTMGKAPAALSASVRSAAGGVGDHDDRTLKRHDRHARDRYRKARR